MCWWKHHKKDHSLLDCLKQTELQPEATCCIYAQVRKHKKGYDFIVQLHVCEVLKGDSESAG
jgi:hypothetical protein